MIYIITSEQLKELILLFKKQTRANSPAGTVFLTDITGRTMKTIRYTPPRDGGETLREENRLLREELNELYLKYDCLAAAFGETSHFIREAADASERHFRTETV